MEAARIAALAGGVVLLVLDAWDLLRALVMPRVHNRGILVVPVMLLRAAARRLASYLPSFDARDAVLAMVEPVMILVRLGIWLGVALVGWALVGYGVGPAPFGRSFVDSGSSLFTLGFAAEHGAGPSAVAFLAAATGLVIVALQIGYLPAIYDAFNRRETLVTLLESRAASPAWGPELLARHHLVGLEERLGALYADWERWSADVAESHTTYPLLLNLRSPHRTNSWILSLVAVLDAAALHLAFCPSTAPYEARLCLRMGFTCLRDIAGVLRIPFDPDPLPGDAVALTYDEFSTGAALVAGAGMVFERTVDEAWPQFRGWRVNYETIAYRVADLVGAPPALWTGPRLGVREEAIMPRRPRDRRPEAPAGR